MFKPQKSKLFNIKIHYKFSNKRFKIKDESTCKR
jgi:hypothetical protein